MAGTSRISRGAGGGYVAMTALLLALALVAASDASAAIVWATPVDLSSGAADVAVPQLALDSSGDALAVWYETKGSSDVIASASRPPGGGWAGSVRVASEYSAYGPQVALDAHGNAVAVWYWNNGTQDVVSAATRPAGGDWSAPQQLSTGGGDADEPQVAVDANGDAVAVWYQTAVSGYDVVMASTLPAGAGSWATPQPLSASGWEAAGPHVWLDPHGDATAVWYAYAGGYGPGVVQAATLPTGGAWTPTQNLSNTAQDSSEAVLSGDPTGDVTAVWLSYTGSTDVVDASTLAAGAGAWVPATQVSSGGDADAPAVTVDAQGNPTAVWDSFDGLNFVIQAATSQPGGVWSSPASISAPSDDAGEAQVAADPQGDVEAIWYRDNGLGDVIEAALRPAGGSWNPSQQVSSPDAYEPQVGILSPSDAMAVWYTSNGSAAKIQASSTTTVVDTGSGGTGGGTGGTGGTGTGIRAPVISHLRVHPTSFRASRRRGGHASATGTTVSYRDSSAATTTFVVLALPRAPRCTVAMLRARRCVIRGRRVGSFIRHDRAGVNSFHLSGRLGRLTLPPGFYRLVASPRDHLGRTGAAQAATFRVIR